MSNTTVLYDDRVSEGLDASASGDHLWLAPADFARATGWKLETQGLCRGDACVQLNAAWRDEQGRIDLCAFARHMGQPVVHEPATNAYAVGESSSARHAALSSGMAPDFSLPNLDGRLHSLSDYRGKKVFLFSWGSY